MTDVVPPAAPRWSDLRLRLVSAAVMITVGAAEIWLGGPAFAALVVALTGGMLWELARMTAPAQARAALALGVLGAGALVLVLVAPADYAPALLLVPSLAFALTPRRDRRLASLWAAAAMVAGYGLVVLREEAGTPAILWVICVVVASDVLGYFAGRMIGGRKFWPAVSPKKTWAGTVAGWLGAAAVGAGFVAAGLAPWTLVPLSALVAFAGQMGDIAESWIKRRAGVKDSSRLIPGHGGLMDRFDALVGAVVAVMALGLLVALPLPGQGG
ncbi:MAG TPA: phosphatidate cytidylyltransferase [Paracoccaceae bacterium]|nr:phosphatidate cytidylyltransferase [Paracoccaceae bacterium]HMO72387.1 phosphatidate cytidylyltransferase [Paracoccaceae bacterium]